MVVGLFAAAKLPQPTSGSGSFFLTFLYQILAIYFEVFKLVFCAEFRVAIKKSFDAIAVHQAWFSVPNSGLPFFHNVFML